MACTDAFFWPIHWDETLDSLSSRIAELPPELQTQIARPMLLQPSIIPTDPFPGPNVPTGKLFPSPSYSLFLLRDSYILGKANDAARP